MNLILAFSFIDKFYVRIVYECYYLSTDIISTLSLCWRIVTKRERYMNFVDVYKNILAIFGIIELKQFLCVLITRGENWVGSVSQQIKIPNIRVTNLHIFPFELPKLSDKLPTSMIYKCCMNKRCYPQAIMWADQALSEYENFQGNEWAYCKMY